MIMTLGQYREIYRINHLNIDEVDRVALSVCFYFGFSHEKVNQMDPNKFLNYSKKLLKHYDVKKPSWHRSIFIKEVGEMTFGMFIEIQHWLRVNKTEDFEAVYVREIHKVAASLLKKRLNHRVQSLKLLECKAGNILYDVKLLIASYNSLLKEYPLLFNEEKEKEKDKKNKSPDFEHYFIKSYGWFFAAKSIAEHEGIKLKEVYDLPIRQALNDLVYLKAKQDYDKHLMKQ